MVNTLQAHKSVARGTLWWVPYLYLLRAQIITALFLVFLPMYARSSSLLNGLFDLDYANAWMSAAATMLVSMASFATAWTLLASCWCTIYNAPDRFDTARSSGCAIPSPGPSARCSASWR